MPLGEPIHGSLGAAFSTLPEHCTIQKVMNSSSPGTLNALAMHAVVRETLQIINNTCNIYPTK